MHMYAHTVRIFHWLVCHSIFKSTGEIGSGSKVFSNIIIVKLLSQYIICMTKYLHAAVATMVTKLR